MVLRRPDVRSYYSQADPNNPFAGLVGAIVITFPGNLVQKVLCITPAI
jgi:hypothetical protein